MPDDVKSAAAQKPREPKQHELKPAPTEPAQAPTDDWTSSYAAFLEGNQQALTRWMQGTMAISQEITRFAQGRLQEDMAAWWPPAAGQRRP